MKPTAFHYVLLSLFVSSAAAVPFLHAQEATPPGESPKILIIQRELTKPGKEGKPHEAAEAAYMHAMSEGKGKMHYMALTSFSGQNRALFMEGYPSLAAWESLRKSMGPTLTSALDDAASADGELLSEVGQSVWMRSDELSSNVKAAASGTRYLEISQYVLKPGHMKEWTDLVKLYKDASANIPELHWTAYSLAYGNVPGPAFLVLTSAKSMADLDAGFGAGKKLGAALSDNDKKKLSDLEAGCIQSEMTNLFAVNPRMSIPTDEQVQADPSFWKSGPTSATTAQAAAPTAPQ